MRVVITGITISGQDIVDIFNNDHSYVTIHQVINDLPYKLTPKQQQTLRSEAVVALNMQRKEGRQR